jgi:putative RNA 2'-phosphotransferase
MDAAGWAQIADVTATLHITEAELAQAVQLNDKNRLQVNGNRIRACQGHSLEGMPVTVTALEASWEAIHPSERLWHGTNIASVEGIAEYGILPGKRSHVHLAPHRDSSVGKRSAVDFLLAVSPDRLAEEGVGIYRAQNGVILVRHVPAATIVDIHPLSDAGRRYEPDARRLLDLPAT